MSQESSQDQNNIFQNRRKHINKLTIGFYITFAICLGFLIQDIFTRTDFFDKSNEVTLHILENTGHGYEQFNHKISTVSMVFDAILIAFVFWITPRQIDGLYLIICTALSLFQMTFFKSLYRDPRPFMVDLDISTGECGPEYGNPSGHGVNNLVMVYVSHFIADNGCFQMLVRDENGKLKLHYRRFTINLIGLILCIIIGWARVCLGMHSMDQVLLGWDFGIIWMIFYILVFYKRFRYFWCEIMSEQRLTKRKKILIPIVIAAHCFVAGMCILVYEENKKHQTIPDLWIQGIEQQCSKPFDSDMLHQSLYHKTFVDMGVFGITFGVLLGFLLMNGNYNEKKIFESYSKYRQNKMLILKRVISDVVLLAISFGIPWISVQFINKDQVYARMFIGYNLASFLAGLSLVLFRARFFKMFRCQIEGDMNYEIPESNKKIIILLEDEINEQSKSSDQETPLKKNGSITPITDEKLAEKKTIQSPDQLNFVNAELSSNKKPTSTQLKSSSDM